MRWCVSIVRPAAVAAFLIPIVLLAAGCQYGVTSPVAPTTVSPSGTGPDVTALTYTKDIQPILASDCVRCHGPSRRDAGVDVSTYANVLKLVTPGSASSTLILVTRAGGIMNGQLSGSSSTRAAKAALIQNWVVSSGAKQ
jgi:hypothetical protein